MKAHQVASNSRDVVQSSECQGRRVWKLRHGSEIGLAAEDGKGRDGEGKRKKDFDREVITGLSNLIKV